MRLTFVGAGDAFGAGGQLQTCLHVVAPGCAPSLIDCGATALIGMKRLGLDIGLVESVFVTHLHGDHFSGLVWLLLEAQFGVPRTRPLTIYGPPTMEARLRQATDALYPGALDGRPAYPFKIVELDPARPVLQESYHVDVMTVDHPSGAPSFGLRMQVCGRTLAFTGDTAWTEAVVALGQGADVYVMDCWKPAGAPRVHLSLEQIEAHLPRLKAPRIVLTHMADEMVAVASSISNPRFIVARDGLSIDV